MLKPFVRLAPLVVVWLCLSDAAYAQLRVVTYNTAGGPREGLDTVLEAIGEEPVNGIARPIDVLILQEQSSWATTSQAIADLLDGIYAADAYEPATLDGETDGGGLPGLVYNTTSIQLIEQRAFGTLGMSAQARQTLRYQLRPVGYGPNADFFVYSNHYKAGTGPKNRDRRNVEATAVRVDLDALGEGVHAILAGDYNIQRSSEESYQILLAAGPGQTFDPIDAPGSWHDNEAFRAVHTQAPSVTNGSGGGMDDRFDFQLVTGEFLDGNGLDYIPGSYRAFGNNGTHDLNGEITSGSGASASVLSALAVASDHLPLVADYWLPVLLVGDYNGNNLVEQVDLDLVLGNWGRSFDTLPRAWETDRPRAEIVDQTELDAVLVNWGSRATSSVTVVPEPHGLVLALLVAVFACHALGGKRSCPVRPDRRD